MFENFDTPITKEEYESAIKTATAKFQRIRDMASPEERQKYSFDYLQLLIQEALLQSRYSETTKNEYKKRHIPKNAPTNTIIITKIVSVVKGGF